MSLVLAECVESFRHYQDLVDKYKIDDFVDPTKVQAYMEDFNLDSIVSDAKLAVPSPNMVVNKSVAKVETPIEPEFSNLCRLHWLILLRKPLTVLELGSGYSTTVIVDAMSRLKNIFGFWANANLRVNNPFHLYSVDESQKFMNISMSRISSERHSLITPLVASVNLYLHDGRLTTRYSQLPNVTPDFIYVDGPSLYACEETSFGLGFADISRVPISSDILPFEFFMEPGSFVLIDGRSANAEFLNHYLKRNWVHSHDFTGDVHYLELQENPFGALNKKKMEFSLNGAWTL
jgi:hypothetical protein